MRGKPRFFVQVVIATTPDIRLLTLAKNILWRHFGLLATIVFKGVPKKRRPDGHSFKSKKRVFDLRISKIDHVKRFSIEIGFGLKRKQRKLEHATDVRARCGSGGLAVKEWLSGWRRGPREWEPRATTTNVSSQYHSAGP
jgi:hypothetical protein